MSDTVTTQRNVLWPIIAAVIAFAILMGLGTWQLQRLAWKEGLLSLIEARISATPLSVFQVEGLANADEDIRYTRVTVSGQYDHDREQHLFQTSDGGPGWHVYTPLTLEGGRVVLVNRGFVPLDLKAQASRPESLVEGLITVTGLARVQGRDGWFTPENDQDANEWYWRDIPALYAAAYGNQLLENPFPFIIDAETGGDPGDVPDDGATIIDISNRHFGYALTWYGLAGTLILVAVPFIVRRFRGAT
ncbi:MAG: SURF1 family protein [Pseudomonadota bacterium]